MFNLKLTLSVLLIISFYGLTLSSAETINNQLTQDDSETNKQFSETPVETVKNLTEKTKLNNTRTARTLITPHSIAPKFTLRRRQPIKIRSRADHFPLRPQIRRIHNGLPKTAKSPPQNVRFGFESLKSSKYVPSSKGANLVYFNNGKAGAYRSLGPHPNSVHVPALSQQYIHNFKASPAFNGQVVVHPMTQTQQKPPVSVQENSYPKYIMPQQQPQPTNAAIQTQQNQQQQKKPTIVNYPEFKQYPIPDQEKMQKFNEQHEKYLQQQKYLTSSNPLAYYEYQVQQQHQLPKIPAAHQELQAQQPQNYAGQQHQYLPQPHAQQQSKHIPISDATSVNNKHLIAFPSATAVPHKMYSVYEENDMTELQNINYQTVSYQGLDKEAQEYLRFMNTNEYFLPKKDPNYKEIDEENDRRQLIDLKSGYEPQSYHTQSQIVSAYQQPLVSAQYSNSLYSGDTSDTSASEYNQGSPVSQPFYQQEPSSSAASSSTVLSTSYQAGYSQNQLAFNAQKKNPNKYSQPPVDSTPNILYTSTPSPIYSYAKQNSVNNRTPEPIRFEFTERDAMVGGVAYTHAPQGQSRYNYLVYNSVTPILANVENSTPTSIDSDHYSSTGNYLKGKGNIKSVLEDVEDDPEDGDDMQEAGNDLYGRQPVVSSDSNANKQYSSTETAPSEQKDTEEYCERICAIVEDENEEIVCGSDGYMYTSEAQMECYASCLHIDVTIQGKGSCSAR